MNIKMDSRDLKKYSKMLERDFPSGYRRVIAEYLNSSAFIHRDLSKKNLERKLIIRDQRFLNNSLRVEKTRPVPIDRQIAESGSIRWQSGTGWAEQQYGKKPERKRTITPSARGGNTRSKVKPKYRLRAENKIYKPEQYQNNFYFMMRILASRGGGQFYLSKDIPTKKGKLVAGLWNLQKKSGRKRIGGILTLLQKKDNNQKVKQEKWSSEEWSKIQEGARKNSEDSMKKWLAIQASRNGLK